LWNSDTIMMIMQGLVQTLYMTLTATIFSYLLGLPLGVLLVVTKKDGIKPIMPLNKILNIIVNLLRSVPFLILLIAIIPFTRIITGTSIGTVATIVPLVIAAFPFVGRLVESSLSEVNSGVVEAAQSMGATTFQIIWKVLIPEAVPSLILGCAIATTTILSYSAMAGVVGGGGLGDIAIRYGYYRYQNDIMIVTVILLVIIVQILQAIGDRLSQVTDNR
jgi:D-methionine transport system permease protein